MRSQSYVKYSATRMMKNHKLKQDNFLLLRIKPHFTTYYSEDFFFQ